MPISVLASFFLVWWNTSPVEFRSLPCEWFVHPPWIIWRSSSEWVWRFKLGCDMGGWLGFGKARMSFDKVDGLWEPLTRLRFDTGSLVWMHLILSFDSLTVLLSPIPPPPPLRLKPVQSEDSTVSLSVVTSFTRLTASSQLHTRLECGSKRTSWANTRPPTLIGSSVTWVWLLHFSNPCSISCWSWAKTFLTFYQTAFPFFFLLFFFYLLLRLILNLSQN